MGAGEIDHELKAIRDPVLIPRSHMVAQNYNWVPEDLMFSSGLCRYQTWMCYTDIHMPANSFCLIKKTYTRYFDHIPSPPQLLSIPFHHPPPNFILFLSFFSPFSTAPSNIKIRQKNKNESETQRKLIWKNYATKQLPPKKTSTWSFLCVCWPTILLYMGPALMHGWCI